MIHHEKTYGFRVTIVKPPSIIPLPPKTSGGTSVSSQSEHGTVSDVPPAPVESCHAGGMV